ncbi:DUF2304 domain-containing protein [Actinomyces trachealis]|uniref:DUF2304 domain-containing protein n=1 Tax=Actinomyces trachealis TaxID=2763540 RepID=UPI0018929448|nr:DUF2304 domain-containing protein [Actinomyces trachealis]
MHSQMIIQSILIVVIATVGWFMLKSPGGARHLAWRRITTLTFVVFAVIAVIFPGLTGYIANLVGVGRGTDLLLYALVVAFLVQILSSFRRNAALERQLTRLARRVALDSAPDPSTPEFKAQGGTNTGPKA